MRLLLVAPSVMPIGLDKYGGVELLVQTQAEALVKAGHSVTVAAPEGSKVPEGVRYIPTVKLPAWQDRDDVVENITRLSVKEDDFDAIHDFSHRNTFKDRAVHMIWHPVVTRYGFQANNRQVTLSKWQTERFKETYKQDSRIMPMWIDTDKMRPVDNPIRERLLYFGAIVPAKGALLAISYAKSLGLDLDVAGGLIPSEVDSPYLKAVREACDGEHIRLHFNVSEEKKRMLIQNAKAVVYPVQQAEAHWMTGMECWCAGTPTLTFNKGAMKEITEPYWGIVVNEEESFIEWMRVIEDYGVELNPRLAQEAFGIRSVMPKWLALYEDLARGASW